MRGEKIKTSKDDELINFLSISAYNVVFKSVHEITTIRLDQEEVVGRVLNPRTILL